MMIAYKIKTTRRFTNDAVLRSAIVNAENLIFVIN